MVKKAPVAKKEKKTEKAPVAKTAEELEQERLDAEVDASVVAPPGVNTVGAAPVNKVTEDDIEETDKVKSIPPTGHFVNVGNLIFDRAGKHVGTEENANDAARKADRYNTLSRKN